MCFLIQTCFRAAISSRLHHTNTRRYCSLPGQGSAQFFCKGQIVNIFSFSGHMVSVATTRLCCCRVKQPWTAPNQMSRACFCTFWLRTKTRQWEALVCGSRWSAAPARGNWGTGKEDIIEGHSHLPSHLKSSWSWVSTQGEVWRESLSISPKEHSQRMGTKLSAGKIVLGSNEVLSNIKLK